MNTPTPSAPDSKTRIALFLPDLTEGGAERIMLNLARELAEGEWSGTSFAVDLVVAQAVGPYLKQVAPSVRLVDLKSSGTLASLPQLARYLRREKPVAMLSALDRANVAALWARKLTRVSTRMVISIHNTMSVEHSQAPHLKAKLMFLFARRSYGLADAIVTVSNGAADDLSRTLGIPRDRVRVIYNPVVSPAMLAAAKEPLDHPWFVAGQP
ncbi:MAG: glycosyltransferase, partial [Armatimonadota bacterium]|nr:glycosyltransferase [Armatimonadota bacterium]